MASPLHSVSVAAAVMDGEGRFLAVRRRDNGLWEPPGGVLELDESIEDGVVREVCEETGLRVEPEAVTGVYKHMTRSIVALVLRCRVVGGAAAPATAEAAEVGWLTPVEVEERMTPAYACRLLDAVLDGPVPARAHDGESVLGGVERRPGATAAPSR